MSKILIIGKYDRGYSRVGVLLKAFRSLGFGVHEHNISGHFVVQQLHFLCLLPKIVQEAKECRFILVPYPGWNSIFIAKAVSKLTGKKLLFDAFISIFNTEVEDVKKTNRHSVRAWLCWLMDKVSCKLADIVLLDTNEHIRYFTSVFSLDRSRFLRAFVGVDIKCHAKVGPLRQKGNWPVLFFYGSFSPLQGIPYIIKSVRALKNRNINFNLVLVGGGGESQLVNRMIDELDLRDRIKWYPAMPYSKLLECIGNADICLGIFGGTKKAKMVIPNKVFDYAAMNKIFITGDSKAMRELFQEGVDYIGCPFADEAALAERIRYSIANLSMLKEKMNPRRRILLLATPEKIGLQLMWDLQSRGF